MLKIRFYTVVLVIGLLLGCDLFNGTERLLGENLVSNNGFELHSSVVGTYSLQPEEPNRDGIASDWYLSWSRLAVKTAITLDAKSGTYAQRIEVAETPSDAEDEYRALVYDNSLAESLKADTDYQITVWVKGQGKFALSMILNDFAFVKFGPTTDLEPEWQLVTFDVRTPATIENIREMMRFFDFNNWGGTTGSDWIIIDDYQIQEILKP